MPTQETKSPSKTRSAKPAAPAYRRRAGYSQAIVTLTDAETRQRRDYWLGEFDQPESRERYHRVIAEWERRGRRLPPPDFDAPPARRADEITIVEMIREYWRWAADYYRPKHTQALDGALTILRQFYGRTAAIDFGPKKLRLLRDHMIRGDGSRRMPWSRKYINAQVQRIVARRPRPGCSRSMPVSRSAANRLRHVATVTRCTPSSSAVGHVNALRAGTVG
jgi:hypothetical protein